MCNGQAVQSEIGSDENHARRFVAFSLRRPLPKTLRPLFVAPAVRAGVYSALHTVQDKGRAEWTPDSRCAASGATKRGAAKLSQRSPLGDGLYSTPKRAFRFPSKLILLQITEEVKADNPH
jgi:hypothetical protein